MKAWFFRSVFAGLVLFATASLAPAEDGAATFPKYVSRIWRTQDGLPESRIRALAQTPDGYLWDGDAFLLEYGIGWPIIDANFLIGE